MLFRSTLVSPIAEWKRVDRLSMLTAPEHQLLREALLRAIYAQAGETYRPDWAFHQYALRTPIGPPLSPGFRIRIDDDEWVAAIYALDVIYCPVNRWQAISRLSDLIASQGERDPLAMALIERLYERAGSQWRPNWSLHQYALRHQPGAPLGRRPVWVPQIGRAHV